MKNILTVCSAGLCRSVGLADVLKLHFEPADVVPVGINRNFGVLEILFQWADHIIVMQPQYAEKIPEQYKSKIKICDVGPDRYGHSHNPELIDQVWRWTRANQAELGITEHNKVL